MTKSWITTNAVRPFEFSSNLEQYEYELAFASYMAKAEAISTFINSGIQRFQTKHVRAFKQNRCRK